MSESIEGGCRCGGIRYRVALERLPPAYACHCRDCQTWSGSAFSTQFIVEEDQLEVSGEPTLFQLTSPDGKRVLRQYGCSTCLSRVYNTNTGRPGKAVVRAGTLDRSDELSIVAHIWTKRIMGGIVPDGAPTWREAAPAAEFASLLNP